MYEVIVAINRHLKDTKDDLEKVKADIEAFKRGERPGVFIDGKGITPGTEGCRCKDDCEFPCWQRLGIGPACSACKCSPFKEDDGEELVCICRDPDVKPWARCPVHDLPVD